MAISKDIWDKAKFLWELDKPLSYIEEKTGISKGQISKKATKEKWKKETKGNELKTEIKDLEKKKETILQKENEIIQNVSKLEDFQITLLKETIENETGNKLLLFSTANLSLIRKNQLLTKNTKQVLDYETIYSEEGKPLSKKPVTVEVELNPMDLKAIDEGVEINAKSLDLAPRFAPKVEVNNNNNQQNIEPPTIIFQRIENK